MSEEQFKYAPSFPDISEQIRRWRMFRGQTQEELEQRAGLAHNAVSRIETGKVKPRLDTIEKIAQALGVHIEALQFGKPKMVVREPQCDSTEALYNRIQALPKPSREKVVRIFIHILDVVEGDHGAEV